MHIWTCIRKGWQTNTAEALIEKGVFTLDVEVQSSIYVSIYTSSLFYVEVLESISTGCTIMAKIIITIKLVNIKIMIINHNLVFFK